MEKKNEFTSCERIKRAITHREADRIPITETSIWPDTILRWQKEGLPEVADVQEYFGLDKIGAHGAFNGSLSNLFPNIVYEETDEYRIDHAVKERADWDAVWFFSDMAYRNGPMFSPAFYDKFLLSHHKRVSDFCKKHDKFLLLHSDGYMELLIPSLIKAGFDVLQPLESRADNDVRIYKAKYGKDICLFGNISADILAGGTKEEIEEEVKTKVTAAKEGGGYIYHSDHSIPPTISLESYLFALDCAREYGKF